MKHHCHCHPPRPWIHHLISLLYEKLERERRVEFSKIYPVSCLKCKNTNMFYMYLKDCLQDLRACNDYNLVLYDKSTKNSICLPRLDGFSSESELLWITAVRLLVLTVWERRLLLLLGCCSSSSSSSSYSSSNASRSFILLTAALAVFLLSDLRTVTSSFLSEP